MKRIEIVIDSVELKKVLAVLDSLNVPGYTVLPDVMGKGGRGERGGDQLADVMKNSFILTVVPATLVEPIIKALRPHLTRFGGLCVVSDCQSVMH